MPTNDPKGQDVFPEPVQESELYDGPKVIPLPSGNGAFVEQPPASNAPVRTLVQPIPKPPEVSASPPPDVRYPPGLLMLALDVLSARLLGFVALLTACLIWAGVVWEPNLWRVIAAGVFSVLVFIPIMAIYWRSGMTGENGS